MTGFLIALLTYLSLLFLWSVLNFVVFAISYLRKSNYLKGFEAINKFVMYLIQIGIFIWGIGILWLFFSNQEWLLLFLALMFGGLVINFYQMFYGLLQAPFFAITGYLSDKLNVSKNQSWQEYEAEIIGPDGKVVGSYLSDDKENKRFAFWFLTSYVLAFLSYIFDSDTERNWGWGDYVVMPFVFIILVSLPIMLAYLIWNLIKFREAFPSGKKLFFANTLRVIGIIFLLLFVMSFLLS